MGIFIKRPLCLFCFCFITATLVGCFLVLPLKLALALLLLAVGFALLLLSRTKPKIKYGLIEGALALLFAALALFLSAVFIDAREKKLNSLVSEYATVRFVVTKEEASSKYFTKYEGKILELNGKKTRAAAYLVLEHEADYSAGDCLLLVGDVTRPVKESYALPSDVSLEISTAMPKEMILCEDFNGFDVSVACGKLRAAVYRVFSKRLEEAPAALSLGILTGDSSMIEADTVRDLRRSGLSHLIAVSGLHLAALIGATELVLKRFYINKRKRCAVITLLSFLLLFLSGFSPSACRAVLMLLTAYLYHFFSSEPDALTSLSIAGAFLLIVSPLSVGSLSFWLSFLATLGIILYAEVLADRRRKRARKRSKARAMPKAVKKIFGALAVTLSANVFICVVLWIFFGEISLVSPLSNLFAALLAEAYLLLSIAVLIFGIIPPVNTILSLAAGALYTLLTKLASLFSSFELSVISLRYPFAGAIICLSGAVLALLFIIKLRRRFVIALVPVISALVFSACLVLYNAVNDDVSVAYINEKESDSLVLSDAGKCIIADVSNGAFYSFYNSYLYARDAAFTEIEAVVLTHYHVRHIPSLHRLFSEATVRSVYLPSPENTDEIDVMRDIVSSAEENGVTLKLYGDGELFEICQGTEMFKLKNGARDGSDRKTISFSVKTRCGTVTYADLSWQEASTSVEAAAFISASDALVLGKHGPLPSKLAGERSDAPPLIAGTDTAILSGVPMLETDKTDILVAKQKGNAKICEFKLFNE